MIQFNIVLKVMGDSCQNHGVIFNAIRERNKDLTNDHIRDMIRNAALHFTPEVRNDKGYLLHPNIQVQVNHGNILHYAFLFSGTTAELISAQRLGERLIWEDCTEVKKPSVMRAASHMPGPYSFSGSTGEPNCF